MAQKVVLIADPGIDTAFAVALAIHDPALDVVGLIASAGNVSAEKATNNMQILVNQFEAQKWPRIGAAIPVEYEIDGTQLHGPDGLGGLNLPPMSLHSPIPGDKLLVELIREYPKQLTIVVLGPATMLALALDRDPEIPLLIDRIVLLGGSWHETGNATPVAEFHFYCDPVAARQVLHIEVPITLIPLDATRKLIFSPSDLLELPAPDTSTCQFLRQIVPYGIRASSNLYGIEGFHLKDVLGIVAVSQPELITSQDANVDVEIRGELTRGMSVIDPRPKTGKMNARLVTGVDLVGVRDYIHRILKESM